ncbi:MAG TPA: hypothetical protein VKR57_06265 [Terriglobales bacterium]|jgi:hypothetical protein|nr:hypothetical protein [Terriglobales bacterium]
MQRRRLEERIRKLCAHALVANEPELTIILAELRDALHKHALRLRQLTADQLVAPKLFEKQ